MLLERTLALDALSELLAQAAAQAGRVALIGGEAGIGKTSLLRAFTQSAACAAMQPLWGACDPLHTPRPLAPLHDMAAELGAGVRAALNQDAGRIEIFSAVLDALGRDARCVVFEDLHWADEATLDLLVYLGRRIERTRTLLLVSYRDDEIGPAHPLRRVLGVLPTALRLSLPPLSPEAVRELAGLHAIDAAAVHRASGGNPFFVTELLAVDDIAGVPATVRDAVLARAAHLPAPARKALDAAAVIGPRIEPVLVQTLAGVDASALDACVSAGVLCEAGVELLEFRHELARQAVLGAIAAPRRLALHRSALAALRTEPAADLARLAHHAEAAQDHAAVREFAPAAARQAAAVGAHREAHAQYERALRCTQALPEAECASLLEAFALECNFVGDFTHGIAARQQAIELRRQLGQVLEQGENLCRLNVLLVQRGFNSQAEEAIEQALALLGTLPPSPTLALAYQGRAFLYMLRRDNEDAIRWGEKAVVLAQSLGEQTVTAGALNVIGSATIHTDYEAGCALLQRSRRLAQHINNAALARNAYSNLGSASGEVHRFLRAEQYLAEAVTLGVENELDTSYDRSWQALCCLHLGRWDEAGELANRILVDTHERAISLNMAHLALGRLRARRGDAGAWTALDEALRLALESGHLQRLAPVRAARAEAAWLEGDYDRCAEEARAVYALAARYCHAWFVGELSYWLRRAGGEINVPDYAAQPYGLEIAGHWREAAAAWQELACPYERARSLAEGDASAQREALAVFESLGARPAAEALRERLHSAGVRGLPRGPRASTRENAFGLTTRELQVLQLLCDGLRNAEIAERLSRSARTIDHHLAAVFAKLGVDSRLAAIQAAQRANIAVQSGQAPTPK